jgi:predicted glycoside hydrolase/deacetylase ChbG (UPF0249 family)
LTRLLVVNGDDFGLARGVNEGIIEAHTNGIVTSTSMMVLRPAAADAAELALRHPDLSVGLHFEDDGSADLDDPVLAARAFREQLERFRALVGRDPTHVDSHHHVHTQCGRIHSFSVLVEPLGVPLRHDGKVAYIADFWAQPDLDDVSRPHLRHLVDTQAGDGFTELACHPARITPDLRSSYRDERAIELQTLTGPGLREELEGSGIKLVSYAHWTGSR